MPGKSRHGRGKHSFQGKKRKGRRSHPIIVSQQQVVTQTTEPVAVPPRVATATIKVSPPTPTAVKYANIPIELRRVGILAGIMLAALLVLALVLD